MRRRDWLKSAAAAPLILTQLSGCATLAPRSSTVYPRNKDFALTFSIDDGFWNSAQKFLVVFERYRTKATFNLVTDWIEPMRSDIRDSYNQGFSHGSWTDWRKVVRAGHEIGSHTLTHPALPEIPIEQADHEIVHSKERILKELKLKEPRTFAFPYNQSSPSVRAIVQRHYAAARVGTQTGEINLPGFIDFWAVRSWWPLSHTTLDEIVGKVEQTRQSQGWLVIGLHGIDDEGWHPIAYGKLEQLMRYLDRQRDLYIGTFLEMAAWLKRHRPVLARGSASSRMDGATT